MQYTTSKGKDVAKKGLASASASDFKVVGTNRAQY
ncbi:uncharacterized protein METZ01_LOCUS74380 [marine metagenome]|uniref:Uncharacterized protein n=1 Tax=marine metagenome TaxID=408172 RepID=A0A381TZV3_9ZZZZ